MLPPGDQQLVQIVDAALADTARRSGDWLVCHPGCTQCCIKAFAINQLDVGHHAAPSLICLDPLFPIIVACVDGVSNVPSVFRLAGRNFGLGPSRLLTRVVFPAALPKIIVGLRIALGIAWLVVVAAEMIAVDSGLGYLVIDSRNSGKRYDLVVAAMLIIGLIGLILDTAFRRLEKIKSVRWGFRDES
jgi:NitT/TauT family transport system permease protein